MLRLYLTIIWLLAAFLGPALAQNKLAFVAGINTYPGLATEQQLQRAVNDADTVGDSLQSLGFKVTRVTTGATLDNLLRRFGDFTRSIRPGDTVFFFFAGHGISLDDGNYLIPADMPALLPSDQAIAKKRAIAEREIKLDIVNAGARVAVVVLDTCRDNPFPRQGTRALGGTTRGLGRLEPAAGVFTLYSAREGQTAMDRLSANDNSRNSVFTRVFVAKLAKPGLSLAQLGNEVRDEVAALAERDGHEQVPAFYDDLRGSGSVFLAGAPKPDVSIAPPASQTEAAQAWAAIKDTPNQTVLADFIRRYGETIYGTLARERLDQLKRQQVSLPPNIQPAGPADMSFFITSRGPGKGADLGGLAGADAHCQMLAASVGAGGKTWRAYLSTNTNLASPAANVHARDRIGRGPWQNAKGEVIGTNIDDLHGDNNKINTRTGLTERGNTIPGVGFSPNFHDILTGSQPDGRAFPGNMNLTCNNYTSSTFGKVELGHVDRTGLGDTAPAHSWNSSHQSRDCSQEGLLATGGNGLFYCFAAQ